ncbi:hypothetical protein MAR_021675, partial [Mya arenaria]
MLLKKGTDVIDLTSFSLLHHTTKTCNTGFIKLYSMVNQRIYHQVEIYTALDSGNEILSVFCDLYPAFD